MNGESKTALFDYALMHKIQLLCYAAIPLSFSSKYPIISINRNAFLVNMQTEIACQAYLFLVIITILK